MKKAVPTRVKTCFTGLVFVLLFSVGVFAQKKTPAPKTTPAANLSKVTQINEAGLKTALTPNGKPLLVNFWATWCDPCREEFPDLVKIDAEYKGKIDFITVSLDDLAEINRDVPKFLASMNAEMPAYLLKVADEGAVISTIAKDWSGGLPFTVLYNEKGEIAYLRQGKVKLDILKPEIDKLTAKGAAVRIDNLEVLQRNPPSAAEGVVDARKDIANGVLKIKKYGFGPGSAQSAQYIKEKYGIEISEYGCIFIETPEYFQAYNATMKAEIQKRFGTEFASKLPL